MDFPSGTPADLARLIAEYPLAWLVNHGAAGFFATPLPLVAELDEAGQVTALIGHCSRRNGQVAALQADPRAQVLFMGPQGYVSPALVSRPHWAPTWNFAVVAFDVTVAFDEAGTLPAVRRLTTHVEASQAQPWQVEDAGARLPQLMARIIGFRATVTAIDARFKLGQEEDLPELREIIAAHPDPVLAGWMWRLNNDRLQAHAAAHGEETTG
ncbi:MULTISPECIES: FMN-binding negative transcriptional regulator [unclassified Novosphingobium]|uniref:FMN-binding negative transcriptional regulator n=1 Tax=unclassified Novosphingobium TaxID=2644732 RepID=UPI00146BAC5D|nr:MULTISPECIES: FMN-binding negative transcriptional regulator [unclassified Novosphingobium]NMN05390.1 transcriptional regulator [Novosphingobium sp. SG919]NMN87685.1 transcriptional regulator [Novosphingobium sp. SG916]